MSSGLCVWLILSMLYTGCTVLVIGAAGSAGVYAVTADGIEGVADESYKEVWENAEQVLKREGTLEEIDKAKGKMVAKQGHITIKFKAEQATPKSVMVRVQARRVWGLFPNLTLAKRIYHMIIHVSPCC
ncbi:MAG: hypothetical protein COV74_07065 [Candidatus Omnitrophica bacterium CG11_big_fil_rev_8_21_14_0_20_45_26]|uniref:DUF3568 domain-containing protein n=1 Tax=Candidatus Abzuiibacterium crystallinum TaxID=1974748 RepID=A0A2H0LNH2_9BACT|nr:MAG: hypothetical protein COV74_07065 [Candidatus Omnitrophica bacterium CG11_big_fil_rev_8_21_14_0_20_45_26]PIW63445.1 MAG: hypothetical protein COW12_10405 [Candidatus Omnitrophica bacterium CG12_big_fil_rev_8_21_14_0_65_45_16]